MPKQQLFGELEKKRPCNETKKRWRDGLSSDLHAIGVQDIWYELAHTEAKFVVENIILYVQRESRYNSDSTCAVNRARINSNIDNYPCLCDKVFRCKGDLTRHNRFCTLMT